MAKFKPKFTTYVFVENNQLARQVRNALAEKGVDHQGVGSFLMVEQSYSIYKVAKLLREFDFKVNYVNLRWLKDKALIVEDYSDR